MINIVLGVAICHSPDVVQGYQQPAVEKTVFLFLRNAVEVEESHSLVQRPEVGYERNWFCRPIRLL